MKQILFFLIALGLSFQSNAQDNVQKFKFSPISRDVNKEARRYEKEGWKVLAGRPPIAQQLDNAFRKQAETDDQGFPKWLIANGTSTSQIESAAFAQARHLALVNLVSLIESNMISKVEADVSTNQISKEENVALAKMIEVSSNSVSKKLGVVNPLFQIKRDNKSNVEVQVMVAYNYEMASKMVLDEMRIQLQKETDDVRKKYENFLNPEIYKKGEIKNYNEPPVK